jgi:chondroitin-sulfate-ABC endolyase/exolyase
MSVNSRRSREGQFATAWIDHGKAPKKQGYEYAVLIGMDNDALKGFRRNKAGKLPPYVVLRKDQDSHIVLDTKLQSWGCVFFRAQKPSLEANGLPITSVDGPCLLMASPSDTGQVIISVADPDLRLTAVGRHGQKSQAKPLTVTIDKGWKFATVPKGATAIGTTITFPCSRGSGTTFTIQK